MKANQCLAMWERVHYLKQISPVSAMLGCHILVWHFTLGGWGEKTWNRLGLISSTSQLSLEPEEEVKTHFITRFDWDSMEYWLRKTNLHKPTYKAQHSSGGDILSYGAENLQKKPLYIFSPRLNQTWKQKQTRQTPQKKAVPSSLTLFIWSYVSLRPH